EACNNAVIPKSFNQQIHPSHLFMLANYDLEKSVHEIVQNYLRRTEAETKWMEKQEQRQNAQQQSNGKQYKDSQQHPDAKQQQDTQNDTKAKQQPVTQQQSNLKQYQHSQQNPNSKQHQNSHQNPKSEHY